MYIIYVGTPTFKSKVVPIFCNNLQRQKNKFATIYMRGQKQTQLGCQFHVLPKLYRINPKLVLSFCNQFAISCNISFRICNLFSQQPMFSVWGANFTQQFNFLVLIPNYSHNFTTNLQNMCIIDVFYKGCQHNQTCVNLPH